MKKFSLKCVGHSLKNLIPFQKTLRPTWCPKMVTGLAICEVAAAFWGNVWDYTRRLKHKLPQGPNVESWSNPMAALWRWRNYGGTWTL